MASEFCEFCKHCGAGLGIYARSGEGTCNECDGVKLFVVDCRDGRRVEVKQDRSFWMNQRAWAVKNEFLKGGTGYEPTL